MNTAVVDDRLIPAVNFRSACDISRACKPTWVSPISPSISARGTKAATESTTTTSNALERTRMSAISKACSPVSGCDSNSSSVSTPSACAYTGSKACSASTKAAKPPLRCASATTCKANVVFPLDSGPYTSTIRPRGTPPIPRAISRAKAPVEMCSIFKWVPSPSFMMAPLPNCRSIWVIAVSRDWFFSFIVLAPSVSAAPSAPSPPGTGPRPRSAFSRLWSTRYGLPVTKTGAGRFPTLARLCFPSFLPPVGRPHPP